MHRAELILFALIAACGSTTDCPEYAECADCAATTEPAGERPDDPLDERPVLEVVQAEGAFRWYDGTSVYRMDDSHRFSVGPASMSGRTVTGCWQPAEDGSGYVAVGQWGWVNGLSRDDDYRRLRFDLRPPHRPVTETLLVEGTVYRSFFLVEELTPISADTYRGSCAGAESPAVE